MENRVVKRPAALVFGAMAGLLAYMWGGLTAGAAALALCALTAFAADRFGRRWGFLPAALGLIAAAVFHGRFAAECALCADRIGFLAAWRSGGLYRPVTGAADSAWLVLLLVCGIFCALYAAAGVKCCGLFASALAAGSVFLAENAAVLCVIVALTVGTFCFGAEELRSLPLVLLTALLALPAVFIELPEKAPTGEVSAPAGMTLYLAKEYEQPRVAPEEYARLSAIFAGLYEHGFYPQQQAAYLLDAAGEELPVVNVAVEGGLVPANVCGGQPDAESIGGFAGGEYTVCPQLTENIFTLVTKLRESDYLDCEGLYREYVYSAYGSLTAEEQRLMEDSFDIDGSLPLDSKLAAIRSAIDARLTVGEGSGSVFEIIDRGSANDEGYARLTVCLAKSCGIAAREVSGIYFSELPQGGRAELSEGEYRVWAEVYIDGAGWAAFETSPEYESADLLLPEGVSAEGGTSVTEGAEKYVYAAAPPRTAAEIRPEESRGEVSRIWLIVPIGLMLVLVLAGRARAAVRMARRKSGDISAALTAAHNQGRQLAELVMNAPELPPENLAERMEGRLAKLFVKSERAYERLRFSRKEPTVSDAETAREFYAEALKSAKKQGFFKNLVRRLRGLY